MVRITGGTHRGVTIQVPVGGGVRPTTGRVREAVFNMLGDRVTGAWILDLFAGSGLLGLEALSRGAESAAFVDSNPIACQVVQANIDRLRYNDDVMVIPGSAIHGTTLGAVETFFARRRKGSEKQTSIIFLDPPYNCHFMPDLLTTLGRLRFVIPGSLVVAEHGLGIHFNDFSVWKPLQYRRYGDTRISIFAKTDGKEPTA
ncbi:MAG: 16S rRNA (guanine(966)-N(2))-methyltransferase RsmD [Magnetococcales bacterium]|nr:16S rRNA (guanine(966)-N(2))-methyltransferase RsmD [Magnetococcales bacterium]